MTGSPNNLLNPEPVSHLRISTLALKSDAGSRASLDHEASNVTSPTCHDQQKTSGRSQRFNQGASTTSLSPECTSLSGQLEKIIGAGFCYFPNPYENYGSWRFTAPSGLS